MTDREKLIELLGLCDRCNAEYCNQCEFGKDIDGCVLRRKEIVADTLLANGVTVQQWISVEDRMPDELPKDGSAWSERVRPSVDVLVKMKGLKELYTAWYSYSRKEWIDVSETHNFGDSVTHWMPMPTPPKENKKADILPTIRPVCVCPVCGRTDSMHRFRTGEFEVHYSCSICGWEG